MKTYLRDCWFLLAALGGSLVLHSVSQIRDHGVETWLPWYLYSAKNWFLPEVFPWKLFDAYHLVKGLSLFAFGAQGYWVFAYTMEYPLNKKGNPDYLRNRIRLAFYEVSAWALCYALVFDVFYHVIWRVHPTSPFILNLLGML